jgi:hypothetical protein
MEKDWNLYFARAFRTAAMQQEVDNLFHGKPRMKISKEQFEGLVVKTCSEMMRIADKEFGL